MSQKPRQVIPEWLSLDNAAKIYPAARTKGWMPLFRVSMTLKDDVDKALMQQALETTLRRIPLFSYRLRRGLFWHFFERQGRVPMVEPDARNPMLPINLTAGHGFQFRLRVHRRRVALEVFHALADGSGAFTFLSTLVAEYLFLRHGVRVPAAPPVLDTREPPAPRGVPQIEVTFDIDANGILHVTAKDRGTGKEQRIRIEASSGLSDDEIKRMRDEAKANAEADQKARERVEKINTADSMIFSTEKQLREFGDKIPADKKSAIESALSKLKDAHKSQDLPAIDKALAELNAVWQTASEEMYKNAQASGPSASQPGPGQQQSGKSQQSGDEVTDVDFEEVK